MDGVSKLARFRLLHWLTVGCVAIVSCAALSGDSGSCTAGLFPPSVTYSNRNMSGLILGHTHPAGCSGCLSAWEFCYIIKPTNDSMDGSVSVTFALWRSKGNMLRMVNKSDFMASLKVPGSEHRFSCEEWSMEGCGVDVREGDLVGVVIDPHSVSIDIVGEVEGEAVMVGSGSDLQDGGLVNSSAMMEMNETGLLAFVKVDPNSCAGTLMPNRDCSSPPTVSNTQPTSQPTSQPTAQTPEEPGGTGVWVWVVVPLLCVTLLVLLLVIPVFIITRWTCCSPTRKSPLQTILLSAGRKTTSLRHTNSRGAVDLGLLENTASGSSPSTSPSPAPQLSPGRTESLANGQGPIPHSRTTLPWQPPIKEGQGGSTCSHMESVKSRSSSKRNPPPVKPKPRHHSSRKEPHSPPADTASSPELTNSEKTQSSKSPPPSTITPSPLPPPTLTAPLTGPLASITTPSEEGYTRITHATLPLPVIRGLLRRSRSVEALCFLPLDLTGSPPREKGNKLRTSHTATGSLPELATPTSFLGSPAVDEDNYTLPAHLLPFPRRSPQPYLQPQALYSYAYSHTLRTLATKYQTLPQEAAKPVVPVKERSHSDTSNPYESIQSCLTRPRLKGLREGEEPDYDEIFSDTDVQSPEPREPSPDTIAKTTPTSAQTTPTPSVHATPTPTARTTPPLTPATKEAPGKQKSTEPSVHYQRRPQHVPCPGPAPPNTSPSQRLKLRSIFSSPVTHAPRAPLTGLRRHSSTTSEGYVNEDEFPRPPCYPTPPSSATLPPSQPTLQRYTKLHSHLMEEDSTYDTPQGSSHDLRALAEQDYDHLEEGGGYDRLESSSSSSSHH